MKSDDELMRYLKSRAGKGILYKDLEREDVTVKLVRELRTILLFPQTDEEFAPLLTVAEVAGILGCSPQHVLNTISERRLQAINIAADPSLRPCWRVSRESLRAIILGAA